MQPDAWAGRKVAWTRKPSTDSRAHLIGQGNIIQQDLGMIIIQDSRKKGTGYQGYRERRNQKGDLAVCSHQRQENKEAFEGNRKAEFDEQRVVDYGEFQKPRRCPRQKM